MLAASLPAMTSLIAGLSLTQDSAAIAGRVGICGLAGFGSLSSAWRRKRPTAISIQMWPFRLYGRAGSH